ncbi:hypothetical protein [Nonomuraea sp. GTA35]|uniref:hypothetical protein n=1 Tax=Nonomuraea sp. GTA35 TaxID=1676746 RepID=UPI0035C01A02
MSVTPSSLTCADRCPPSRPAPGPRGGHGRHGVSHCAIFNRREEGTPDFDAIDPILGKATGTVTTWPTTDHSPRYS